MNLSVKFTKNTYLFQLEFNPPILKLSTDSYKKRTPFDPRIPPSPQTLISINASSVGPKGTKEGEKGDERAHLM